MGAPWLLQVKQYRVKKQTPLREFREQLAADMGVPVHQQRLWTFAKRQNNTLRCSHAGAPLGKVVMPDVPYTFANLQKRL